MVLHLAARSKKESVEEQLLEALQKVQGAYSFVFLTQNKLIVARDPYGVRPLAFGNLDDIIIIASETCAFDLVGAEYIRDVKPGEFISFDESGERSWQIDKTSRSAHCIFEKQ